MTSFPLLCTAVFICLIVCLFVVFLLGLCAVCLVFRAFHGWLVCRTLQLCFPALFPVELFPAFNTLGLSCVLHHRLFPRALQRRLVFPRLAWLTCLPPFTALFSRACNLFHDLRTWPGLHVIGTWHRQVCFIIVCSEFRLAYKLHVVFLLCIIIR